MPNEHHKPSTLCPPEADPKWRFFWRLGERPPVTSFPQLNAAPVIPQQLELFPDWSDQMNSWGNAMLTTVTAVAQMTAVGLDLPADTFRYYVVTTCYIFSVLARCVLFVLFITHMTLKTKLVCALEVVAVHA
jgi:isopenicillin N synthase-like dioxygenase